MKHSYESWRHNGIKMLSTLLSIYEENHPVTGGIFSLRGINEERIYLYCDTEQSVEQTVESSMNSDALMLMWVYGNNAWNIYTIRINRRGAMYNMKTEHNALINPNLEPACGIFNSSDIY